MKIFKHPDDPHHYGIILSDKELVFLATLVGHVNYSSVPKSYTDALWQEALSIAPTLTDEDAFRLTAQGLTPEGTVEERLVIGLKSDELNKFLADDPHYVEPDNDK